MRQVIKIKEKKGDLFFADCFVASFKNVTVRTPKRLDVGSLLQEGLDTQHGKGVYEVIEDNGDVVVTT